MYHMLDIHMITMRGNVLTVFNGLLTGNGNVPHVGYPYDYYEG